MENNDKHLDRSVQEQNTTLNTHNFSAAIDQRQKYIEHDLRIIYRETFFTT